MNNTTYSTGTVSVGANSTTLTGVGTAWATAGIRPGDILFLAGQSVIIAAVVSNTSITLKRGWPGAAQAAANYDIMMVDDGVRSLTAANALLSSLTGGTLSSLAGLPGAANKLPYFTGAGVMALADMTAEARTLLASALLARSGNNLVTLAAARLTGGAVTQSATDSTAGRLMKVNDFGLGGQVVGLLAPSNNLNLVSASGWNDIETGTLNKPTSINQGACLTTVRGTNRSMQIAMQVQGNTDPAVFVRQQSGDGTVWSPWRPLTPERDSNANGEFVRFADGTQICTHQMLFPNLASDTTANSSWVYPSAFSGRPTVHSSHEASQPHLTWSSVLTSNSTSATVYCRHTGSPSLRSVNVTAIGRWF